MGEAVERLVALAGKINVEGYTRKTKTGKTVHVSQYTRSPGTMADGELFKEYMDLANSKKKAESGLSPQAADNRRTQVLNEIRKREQQGTWNPPNLQDALTPSTKMVGAKAPEAPKPEAPKTVREQFDRNRAEPQAKLTDDEYAAHVEKVRNIINDPANKQFDTQEKFGVKGPDGKPIPGAYTPEREAQHKAIIDDILSQHDSVPLDKKAIMSGGLGGAGKGYVLGSHADVNHDDYLTIDPDEMKQELLKRGMVPEIPGLLPMEHAAFMHEESSDLANLLHQVAMERGMNVVLDTTMASEGSVMKKVQKFKDNGYDLEAVFVDVPVSVSKDSALGRHRGGVDRFRGGVEKGHGEFGGRFVPPEYIEKSLPEPGSPWPSKNRGVFEELKKNGVFSRARVFDNSDRTEGAIPKLVSDTMKMTKAAKKAADNGPLGTKTTASAKKDKVALSAVELLMRSSSR